MCLICLQHRREKKYLWLAWFSVYKKKNPSWDFHTKRPTLTSSSSPMSLSCFSASFSVSSSPFVDIPSCFCKSTSYRRLIFSNVLYYFIHKSFGFASVQKKSAPHYCFCCCNVPEQLMVIFLVKITHSQHNFTTKHCYRSPRHDFTHNLHNFTPISGGKLQFCGH